MHKNKKTRQKKKKFFFFLSSPFFTYKTPISCSSEMTKYLDSSFSGFPLKWILDHDKLQNMSVPVGLHEKFWLNQFRSPKTFPSNVEYARYRSAYNKIDQQLQEFLALSSWTNNNNIPDDIMCLIFSWLYSEPVIVISMNEFIKSSNNMCRVRNIVDTNDLFYFLNRLIQDFHNDNKRELVWVGKELWQIVPIRYSQPMFPLIQIMDDDTSEMLLVSITIGKIVKENKFRSPHKNEPSGYGREFYVLAGLHSTIYETGDSPNPWHKNEMIVNLCGWKAKFRTSSSSTNGHQLSNLRSCRYAEILYSQDLDRTYKHLAIFKNINTGDYLKVDSLSVNMPEFCGTEVLIAPDSDVNTIHRGILKDTSTWIKENSYTDYHDPFAKSAVCLNSQCTIHHFGGFSKNCLKNYIPRTAANAAWNYQQTTNNYYINHKQQEIEIAALAYYDAYEQTEVPWRAYEKAVMMNTAFNAFGTFDRINLFQHCSANNLYIKLDDNKVGIATLQSALPQAVKNLQQQRDVLNQMFNDQMESKKVRQQRDSPPPKPSIPSQNDQNFPSLPPQSSNTPNYIEPSYPSCILLAISEQNNKKAKVNETHLDFLDDYIKSLQYALTRYPSQHGSIHQLFKKLKASGDLPPKTVEINCHKKKKKQI